MVGWQSHARASAKSDWLSIALFAVALLEAGCVGSAQPRHDATREAPTGLAEDDAVSVTLDSASFLSARLPETLRDEGGAVRPLAFDLNSQEDRIAECIFDALKERRPSVHTVPPRQLWKAAYPDLEPEALPRDQVSWEELATDPAFQNRIGALDLRYVVVVGIEETHDGTEGYGGGDIHFDTSGSLPAAIGAGAVGSSRTTSLRMKAMVVDFEQARRVGTVTSTSTGTQNSTLVMGIFVWVPFAFPVFTGETPTHGATCEELGETVAEFLFQGSASSLHVAVAKGDIDELEQSIAYGADIEMMDNEGKTALHKAAFSEDTVMARSLIAHGADVNAKDNFGNRPLHLAVASGNRIVAQSLVTYGADVDAKTKYGSSALHLAARKGDEDLILLLFELGADINASDRYGNRPLHLAVQNRNQDVARLLIAHGADVNAWTVDGDRPLRLAIQYEDTGMIELLEKHGAQVYVCAPGRTPSDFCDIRYQHDRVIWSPGRVW
jgi:ankyrin repeat protein